MDDHGLRALLADRDMGILGHALSHRIRVRVAAEDGWPSHRHQRQSNRLRPRRPHGSTHDRGRHHVSNPSAGRLRREGKPLHAAALFPRL